MVGIGLMSGTSLDGLDVALVDFPEANPAAFSLLKAQTFSYPPELSRRLAHSPQLQAADLADLDMELGNFMGKCVKKLPLAALPQVDFIASHGHTVVHHPEKGFSLQIGNPNALAAQTQLLVVADFRNLDIQMGGQGAPLVPAADAQLFHRYTYCLNLGGIANISMEKKGKRMGMDLSICNLALNFLAQKMGKAYDDQGKIAASGKIQPELLDALNNSPYLPQKLAAFSLDKDASLKAVVPLLNAYDAPDAAHTLCHHIAEQIAKYATPDPKAALLITGGGAYHRFLVDCIRRKTAPLQVHLPDADTIDFKEAIVFAWLGMRRLLGKDNVLQSVTGAKANSCTGGVYGGHFSKF